MVDIAHSCLRIIASSSLLHVKAFSNFVERIPYHWSALHPQIFTSSLPLHVIPVQPRATTKMYQGMQQRCLYITQPTQRAGWSGHFNGALCFTDADGAGEPVVVGSSGSQWSQHSEFLCPDANGCSTDLTDLADLTDFTPTGPGDWWRGPWCCNSGAPGDVKQDTPGDANSGNMWEYHGPRFLTHTATRPRWKVPKHGVWTIDVLDAPW